MYAKLKDCVWERCDDGTLVILPDIRQALHLDDPQAQLELLLTALRDGCSTPDALREDLAARGAMVSVDELAAALSALNDLGLVEKVGPTVPSERNFSNDAFFGLFSDLRTSRSDMLARVRDAHVLQLGTGGLGSNTIQCLAGLGVGRLTLLDFDEVAERNFARQFLYRRRDVGRRKVERAAEWVREFDPDIAVATVERRVTGPADLADLLVGVNVVVDGIDQPRGVDGWINEACMRAGVPHIRGGMRDTWLRYYSVDPGRSACFACNAGDVTVSAAAPGSAGAASRLVLSAPRVNQAIGPAAALLGSLVAFEALRYISGYEPPQAAGVVVVADLRDGITLRRDAWKRNPDCDVCALAPRPTEAVAR